MALKLKPNPKLAELLRNVGLQRVADSARLRRLFGLPVRTSADGRSKTRKASKTPKASKVGRASLEALETAKEGLPWQRLQMLEEGAEQYSLDIRWQRELAKAYGVMGRHQQSAETWARVHALDGARPFDFFAQAHEFRSLDKLPAAQEAADRGVAVARRQGKRNTARRGLGGYYERRRDWDLAAQAYAEDYFAKLWKAERNEPELAWLAQKAGAAYLRTHDWAQAERFYRAAWEISSTPLRTFRLAVALEEQGKADEAIELYLLCAETASRESRRRDARYRAAYLLTKSSKEMEACEILLPDFPPISVGGNGRTSRLLSVQGRYLSGESSASLAGAPCFAPYWLKKAGQAEAERDLPARIRALHAVVDREPSHPAQALAELARLEYKSGDYGAAAGHLLETRILRGSLEPAAKDLAGGAARVQAAKYAGYLETLDVRGDVVFFESFHGKATDHPYAIFKAIRDDLRFKDHLFVWALDKNAVVPEELRDHENVAVVPRGSDQYLRHLATAKWLVNNVTFPPYFLRREGQKYLNTWHGSPLKTLGKDVKPRTLLHANAARNFLHATHLLSGNQTTTEALVDRQDIQGIFTGKVAELGSPRSDVGISADDSHRRELRERLGIEEDDTVVFYAPTWRGRQGAPSSDTSLEAEALEELAQTGASVFFRGHHFSAGRSDHDGSSYNVLPEDIHTNDFLAVVDVLVSDYSSVMIDFLPFDRPVVFYVPDEAEYREQRGLYIDFKDVPGEVCRSKDDLAEAVNRAMVSGQVPADDEFVSRRAVWKQRFAPHEDGRATERAVDFFFFDDNAHVVSLGDEKPRILLLSALVPNGISAAALSLARTIDDASATLVNLIHPGVLTRRPERKEPFEQYGEVVQHVGRIGAPAYTEWEHQLVRDYYHAGRFLSSEHKRRVFAAHAREFRRVFGPVVFDAAVDFGGYASLWTTLMAASKQVKGRYIYQHSDMGAEWRNRFPNLETIFALYSSFDKIVSVSPSLKEVNERELAPKFGLDRAKFVAAKNQMDVARIRDLAALPLDPETSLWLDQRPGHTFITVGRLSLEKRQDLLLRAFARVSETLPSKLLVVGDGFLRDDLEALANELGVSDRVLFTGYLSNAMAILNRADTFVLTSSHEGLPMVLGEALALGKNVISTDLPGARDLLGDSSPGIVSHEVASVAEAMSAAASGSLPSPQFDVGRYQQEALEAFSEVVGVPLSLLHARDTLS